MAQRVYYEQKENDTGYKKIEHDSTERNGSCTGRFWIRGVNNILFMTKMQDWL